jgi:LPXTG-site transpeptidase (sortase) family protein
MSRRERISDFTRANTRVIESRVPARSVSRTPVSASVQTEAVPVEETFVDIKRRKIDTKPAKPRQNKSNVLRRQGLKKLPPFVPRKVKKHFSPKIVIPGVALLLLLVSAAFVFGNSQHRNSQNEGMVQSATDSQPQLTADELFEKEPTQAEHKAHKVSKEAPRYLRAPKLQMDARVVSLPQVQGQTLPDPANIFDVGWYEGSNLPNTPGASLMMGYVGSPSKDGVFNKIGSLQVGDLIEVELGGGSRVKYKVIKTKTYKPESLDMTELLASIVPEKQGLNLITVSERFDVRTQKYEDRFVVFAVRE